MIVCRTIKAVILSDREESDAFRRESKDLRTDLPVRLAKVRGSFDSQKKELRLFRSLRMTRRKASHFAGKISTSGGKFVRKFHRQVIAFEAALMV